MLLLTTTSTVLRLVTDSAATVDAHASYVDRNGSTDTPGAQNTAISSATTTTIVSAPGSSTARNVRNMIVRNKSNSTSVTVTTELYDGSTAYELDKRVLGPGQSFQFIDGQGFLDQQSSGAGIPTWYGELYGIIGNGDPGVQMVHMQRAGNVAATPTNISTSVARCSLFTIPQDTTINTIRFYGVGATTNVYRCAIYRYSDLARLTSELAFTTAANTWGTAGTSLALALTANVVYFMACSVNATGTTAGVGCIGGTVAATTGQVNTAPGSLPGQLEASLGYMNSYMFQFAVSSGALPATAASLVAQATWTGGMPAFWLDNS